MIDLKIRLVESGDVFRCYESKDCHLKLDKLIASLYFAANSSLFLVGSTSVVVGSNACRINYTHFKVKCKRLIL